VVDVVVQRLVMVGGGAVVELVGEPAAGHRDVAPFAVQRLRAEDVGVVDGESLGFVSGDGVAVGDVAGVEVAARQGQWPTPVVDRFDGACGRVGADDGGAGAVDHAERPVVAEADDPLADLQLDPATGDECGAGELSGGEHPGAGVVVEVVDVGVTQADHDRAGQIRAGGGPPVVDPPLPDGFGGVGGADPAVGLVGGQGDVGVAVAQLIERRLFPWQLLPAVVGQLDHR
jgi:hypothetical protein